MVMRRRGTANVEAFVDSGCVHVTAVFYWVL